jgi:PPOX class probable F420-dependent enzyme
MDLPDHIRQFLDVPRPTTIATLDPGGAPTQAAVWYLLDGDSIIINSLVGRQWPANLRRDPRISLAVRDAADGYRWVGLTGTATALDDRDEAQEHIATMARSYHAANPEKAETLIRERFLPQHRVSFRISIERIHDHL